MGTKNNPGNFDCYGNAEPDEPMPTPAEWNKKHPKPSPFVEHAPVACPRCGSRMFYPFGRDFRDSEDVVRCPKGCVQTTINRDN